MSQCFAVLNPIFQPAMRLIAAISQSNPAQVTTTFAHQYVSGTIVRLNIPQIDGMQELDTTQWPITVTGSTTFTIPVDSTAFSAFAIPVSPPFHANTCAQVVPTGEINETLAAAVRNVLPFSS
jgi:hypothetical protein